MYHYSKHLLCIITKKRSNTSMEQPLLIENQILINAAPGTVWHWLVSPDKTKQYMFGCEVVSNWQIGQPMNWVGAADGVAYVTGNLVTLEQEKEFAYTTFDPQGTYVDIPENHLTVTYTLTAQAGGTLLKVTQGDYAAVADGAKRYEDTMAQGGWGSVLAKIKALVEGT